MLGSHNGYYGTFEVGYKLGNTMLTTHNGNCGTTR